VARIPKDLKFEEAMERLDRIVADMESGQIGIEESIAKYEEAMELASHCRRILEQAEQRVRKIHLDAQGRLKTEPFDESAQPESGSDAE